MDFSSCHLQGRHIKIHCRFTHVNMSMIVLQDTTDERETNCSVNLVYLSMKVNGIGMTCRIYEVRFKNVDSPMQLNLF
jgi:hypothetical protein